VEQKKLWDEYIRLRGVFKANDEVIDFINDFARFKKKLRDEDGDIIPERLQELKDEIRRGDWKEERKAELTDFEPIDTNSERILVGKMQSKINEKLKEGYYIANPNLPKKAWNKTVGKAIDLFTNKKQGTCGDAYEWGADWYEPIVKEVFGPDAVMTQITVEADSLRNHTANEVILPNGERYIIDNWISMIEGSPCIYPEDKWIKMTKKNLLSPNATVVRGFYEDALEGYAKESKDVNEAINRKFQKCV